MRQVSLIALVSVLALVMGGCPANEEEDIADVTPSPSRVAPAPSPTATPFANPLTPNQPTATAPVAGLIQSLPPEARVNQIPKGRNDPFAALPLQPQVTVSPNPSGPETTTRPVPVVPQIPQPPRTGGGNGRNQARTPAPNQIPSPPQRTNAAPPRPNTNGNQTRPSPSQPGQASPSRPGQASPSQPGQPTPPSTTATAPSFVPELPPLPEPTLARQVEVTGVVNVGGVPRAIVKAPDEPSRYVQAGDRLANGQVLVKRIETRGANPSVILEQYGIEVARDVGEAPSDPGQLNSPTAARPLPPPPPIN